MLNFYKYFIRANIFVFLIIVILLSINLANDGADLGDIVVLVTLIDLLIIGISYDNIINIIKKI